jgi:hypothetical protein
MPDHINQTNKVLTDAPEDRGNGQQPAYNQEPYSQGCKYSFSLFAFTLPLPKIIDQEQSL